MEKLQVLFPAPTLSRLRRIAQDEDKPVSELIRTAVDRFLQQRPPEANRPRRPFPTFQGGRVLVDADRMKELIYEDDAV